MMAFIVFCILIYLVFMFDSFIKIIKGIFQIIFMIFAGLFESEYKRRTMGKRLEKEDKIKEEEMLQRCKKIQASLKERENKNIRYEQTMTNGIFNKIRELRFKYPQANPELFDEYQNNSFDFTIVELDELEKRISDSHFYNIKNKGTEIPDYNYSDIEGITPLEEIRENPLYIKLIRKNNCYIAVIQNILQGSVFMYQSTKYLAIMDLCNGIINQIHGLRNEKKNITSFDIDNMIKYYAIDNIDIKKTK